MHLDRFIGETPKGKYSIIENRNGERRVEVNDPVNSGLKGLCYGT